MATSSCVWDGKEMRTYIDGVKKGGFTICCEGIASTDAPLYVGVGANKNWFCKGFIDEVRIWEVARTEKEINEFMMTILNGDEKGLNAHYTFDESNAKTVPKMETMAKLDSESRVMLMSPKT